MLWPRSVEEEAAERGSAWLVVWPWQRLTQSRCCEVPQAGSWEKALVWLFLGKARRRSLPECKAMAWGALLLTVGAAEEGAPPLGC